MYPICTMFQNTISLESHWWVLSLTGKGQQRLKVSTLSDAGAVLGAGVPQVLKQPLGDDDAAGHGGKLPVVVGQRRTGDQPADYTHEEPGRFHSRRHGGNVSRETPRKKSNKSKNKKPSKIVAGMVGSQGLFCPNSEQKSESGWVVGGSGLSLSVISC